MSADTPPPPPPSETSSPQEQPPAARSAARWKVATAVVSVLGLALTGTVYVLMDQRADELRSERDTARAELEDAREEADSGLGGLEDLLGGLGGSGEGDGSDGSGEGLGGLEELLGGDGGLGDLLGTGGLDPILLQCLGGAMGLGGDGSIPEGDVRTQVTAIKDIIEAERGLPAGDDVDIEFVSREEVQRRAVERSTEDIDRQRARVDSRMLAALGAVEPGTDLAQAQLDALEAGVGGFYDPETEKLVIGSKQMDGLGAFITSHELVHALADAELGLPDQQALARRSGSDAAYAALNAIEGDASLYSQRFVGKHLPMDELLALQSTSAQTDASLDQLPHVVARELEFPYVEGMTFSCDLYLQGGWKAVDRSYDDLPDTTAQILFPDRYRDDEQAVDVTDPAGPEGWKPLRTDTFGAADLLFLLEAPGDDEDAALSDPKKRVAAWAGGEINVWGRGGDTATALTLADRGGSTPMCDTVTRFYAAAFPDATRTDTTTSGENTTFESQRQSAVVSCQGDEVRLSTAPDLPTARSLAL
ncbi:hypothetical protein CLV30_11280 [Haloactinopolyspora alba]|uniref:Uncharacterized protein n=1 Tax=Haloactinopolyspora alba TaxID=648780 RepID=A0A2P8DX91_9ACTN|nr:hypothetical protein [Haloactinopolyspora alba]PSL01841.1 hypothetical protein CLV30_11280 [Haloactinopolyspora alba]